MIIIGANGFAKELLQVISVDYKPDDIVFFDNVNKDTPNYIFEEFKILKSFEEGKAYFQKTKDKSFVMGLGSPIYRETLYNNFVNLGGVPITTISKNAEIGSFDVSIGYGTAIMSGVSNYK